jgi:succinate dehydrogenase/fumarate reductase-like Fe-S protein
MTEKIITVEVQRSQPSADEEPHYKTYQVPLEPGMTAMGALDYIYQNLDSTVAYYDHAGCSLGICARCIAKINGRAGLLCQTPIDDDIRLEPAFPTGVVKDLVVERRSKTQE